MKLDVVVIGGGHAGAEAARAAALLGAHVALVTMRVDAIARMSCNPAIGGLGKGHMVREIDALGGLMGLAIDATGIQFRTLNASKGPAVRAPRAQADRGAYAGWVRDQLATVRGLELVEGLVEEIETRELGTGNGEQGRLRVCGVRLADGRRLRCDAAIITSGTFLRGLMHCGARQTEGGRIDEPSARGLSDVLRELGFELARQKTGTPPRIHRDTIDYDALIPQDGDDNPRPFSFMTERLEQPQIRCWITHTNADVHAMIHSNLHLAPMYNGQITSQGPRYCPSIEDKVVRFADKTSHQVFLEPEGYDDERVYCNGISTSLPAEVQDDIVHSIHGLHAAKILQYGYAVEYDCVPTHQIRPTLETKRVAGLYLAGQINGTSGYEEAAGQGLIAGINAARDVAGKDPLVLRRDQAYIGVMIDDLITRPPVEPYRMFTSRAEYRLHLRSDNADQRLTPIGREFGLVDEPRWARFRGKSRQLERVNDLVGSARHDGVPLAAWLRRPESTVDHLRAALGSAAGSRWDAAVLEQIHTNARYDGYLQREAKLIERFRRLEDVRLPGNIEYNLIPHLRAEAREQLLRATPATLGQASRLPGITAADLTVLWVQLAGRRVMTQ